MRSGSGRLIALGALLSLNVAAARGQSQEALPTADWHVALTTIRIADTVRVAVLPDGKQRRGIVQGVEGDTLVILSGRKRARVWAPDITRLDVGRTRSSTPTRAAGYGLDGLVIGAVGGGAIGYLMAQAVPPDLSNNGTDARGAARVILGGGGMVAGALGGFSVGMYRGSRRYLGWQPVLRR